jgi:putative endonuclease
VASSSGAGGDRAADRITAKARLGCRAEDLAAAHLQGAGMRILQRNWRRPEGELDLVALDIDGTCVFCEVRSRTGLISGDPLEAIGRRKQLQVIRTARHYLASELAPVIATGFRFDVVAVTFFEDGQPPQLAHIRGAFETGG